MEDLSQRHESLHKIGTYFYAAAAVVFVAGYIIGIIFQAGDAVGFLFLPVSIILCGIASVLRNIGKPHSVRMYVLVGVLIVFYISAFLFPHWLQALVGFIALIVVR